MNIVSLDPMYSPLHKLIAQSLPSGKRLALLSSLGLSIYLPGFSKQYINKEVKSFTCVEKLSFYKRLAEEDVNHHTMKVKKSGKKLSIDDVLYMAKFCLLFDTLVEQESVDLVLLHNDLRWQHSLAIKICKLKGIKYLVTEQGMFRPLTTVVDKKGVNAFSSVKGLNFNNELEYDFNKGDINFTGHSSLRSMLYFAVYLILSKIGVITNNESRIVHNRHKIKDYLHRFILMKKKVKHTPLTLDVPTKYIFIPLQLENDTQMLVHSEFSSNQEIIVGIENAFSESALDLKGYKLVFKLHPNDPSNYIFSTKSVVTSTPIFSLLEKAILAITVNSSAALEVISTTVPLICLGDSMYEHDGVASKLRISELKGVFNQINWPEVNMGTRRAFISFLKKHYSIIGAGFTYPESEINRIKQYIESDGAFLE